MVEADSCGGGYFTSATTTSTFLGYLSENSGRYSGTWVSQTNSNFVGSSARKSSSNGASVTYTVAAKNYAYLSPENVGLGQAKEYVAGSFFTTVDLSNSYLSNTLVISRKSYTTKASRTYKIQEASGTGPIMTDGLAYMY